MMHTKDNPFFILTKIITVAGVILLTITICVLVAVKVPQVPVSEPVVIEAVQPDPTPLTASYDELEARVSSLEVRVEDLSVAIASSQK